MTSDVHESINESKRHQSCMSQPISHKAHLYLASPPISRSTASLHLSRGILSTMGLMLCRDANWNISRIRARPPTQLPTTLNSAILINRTSNLCDSENDRPILSVKRPTEHLKNTQDTQRPPTQLLHATQEASHARSSVKFGRKGLNSGRQGWLQGTHCFVASPRNSCHTTKCMHKCSSLSCQMQADPNKPQPNPRQHPIVSVYVGPSRSSMSGHTFFMQLACVACGLCVM